MSARTPIGSDNIAGAATANMARRMLFFIIMKYLRNIILLGSLMAGLASCYVETRGPRYAHRGCAYGYYWDGYRCHSNHRR